MSVARISSIALLVMLSLVGSAMAESTKVTIYKPAPGFTLADHKGVSHTLSQYSGKTVVLEWTNVDCPFVKKHYGSKNMQNLQKQYTDKGVIWLSICSSAKGKQGHLTGEDLAKRLQELKPAHTAYLIDADGKVGKLYAAKTTPHMFVIDSAGNLAYAGAIDNRPSTEIADIAGAANYLSAALNELLAGKDVTVKVTKSYGCSVKY